MAEVFNANISGAGSSALSSAGFLASGTSRVISLGPSVSRFSPPDGSHLRGLGWFAIGFSSDDGSGNHEYYSEPIFLVLNYQLIRFGTFFTDVSKSWGPYADSIRWWLSPGSVVNLDINTF